MVWLEASIWFLQFPNYTRFQFHYGLIRRWVVKEGAAIC